MTHPNHSSPLQSRERLEAAHARAVAALLRERTAGGWWEGELSSSALATATAAVALLLVARERPGQYNALALREPALRGLRWLVGHQNSDGGWGDTTRSRSNASTTLLVWAAYGLEPGAIPEASLAAAEGWLRRAFGSLAPDALVRGIERSYGKDRTFSIPILTLCALCGRLGAGESGWRRVRSLPFEVAVLPQRWFGALQLPVVSYALPALIAIGLVRHVRQPSRNPLLRALRERCRARVLAKLASLQPGNGGFLEATPLTSFVTMSLAGCGLAEHSVASRGVAFILASERADGSWPIDTHLATWLTSLSCQALGAPASAEEGRALGAWLLGQQYRRIHPFTLAEPGGWAWTPLPGGVPDADDTAGALLALRSGARGAEGAREGALAGVEWLLRLQNRDGGIPTFCRGWGRLPFDRSSPDLTAHALRAWTAWREEMPETVRRRLDAAVARAEAYLLRIQRADGAWVPLWFGNQEAPDDENPLYGTTRVLLALYARRGSTAGAMDRALERALEWLVAQQNDDGGWSGCRGGTTSLEETSLALEALAAVRASGNDAPPLRATVDAALARGTSRLVEAVEAEAWREAAPIGLYFAKLWYFERLYPLVFAVAALGGLVRLARECDGSPLARR